MDFFGGEILFIKNCLIKQLSSIFKSIKQLRLRDFTKEQENNHEKRKENELFLHSTSSIAQYMLLMEKR